jgi:cytochrome c553
LGPENEMENEYVFTVQRVPPTMRQYGLWVRAAALLGILLSGPALSGDAEKAKNIVTEVCSACHGMDGNSTVPTFPKLAGRHPEYLVRELKQFVSGYRKSEIMVPIATALDPDDFKALGEYFGAQKPGSNPVLDQAAAAIGRKLYLDGDEQKGLPSCAGCHSSDGVGRSRFPRLAGQHKEYLIEQMYNFKNDVRNYGAARFMREVTKRMSDDEIKSVAEFLSGL